MTKQLRAIACGALSIILLATAFVPLDTSYAYVSDEFDGYEEDREYNTSELYNIEFRTNKLGLYGMTIESHEIPSNEWLTFISHDYFPYTTLSDQTEVDNTAPSAVYSAQGIVKVDVVFATGELSQSTQMQDYMDTFESVLQSASNNIDARVEKVETSTISSSDFNIDTILNSWTQYGAHVWSSNRGMLTCALPGGSSVGSGSWQGTIMLDPNGWQTGDIMIECTSNNAAELMEGLCWHVTQNADGTFNGYFLNFGAHGYLQPGRRDGVSLMRFSNVDFNQRFDGSHMGDLIWCGYTGPSYQGRTVRNDGATITHLATYGNLLTGKVRVNVTGPNMEVYFNDQLIMQAQDSTYPIGSYGFWGNNCEVRQSMLVSDITITTGATKTLGEAISDVAWRDGSVRFVIHATDVIPEECKAGNDEDFAYTITKLLNANCYLVNLGIDSNKGQLDRLVEAIMESDGNSKGTFYYNNRPNIQVAMDNSANYIISIAKQFEKPVDWILVNTEILWNTIYSDSENDPPLNLGEHNGQNAQPQDTSDIALGQSYGLGNAGSTLQFDESKILAERWRYRHYNNFFDNSPVQVSWHEVWIEDPVSVFEYPGKYRINYKRRDNPLYPSVDLSDPFDSYRYWSTDYDYAT